LSKVSREYLRERRFRVLALLSNELDAKVRQAQSTTKSFSKLLAATTMEGAGQSIRGDQLPTIAPSNRPVASRKKYLEKYLEIYLNVAQVGDKSLPDVADCKAERDNVPLELSVNRNTLVLSVNCPAKNEKNAGSPALNGRIPLYTALDPRFVQATRRILRRSSGGRLYESTSERCREGRVRKKSG